MNPEKLSKLQSQVRIGGKGTARRKKKVLHRSNTTDDKKLQSTLKKLTVNSIPGIEEVNMFKEDGTVIHFTNPKVQASLNANTFAVTGHSENKNLTEMMPGIINQIASKESLNYLKTLASMGGLDKAGLDSLVSNAGAGNVPETIKEEDDDDDEVPQLVENFDEAAQIVTEPATAN